MSALPPKADIPQEPVLNCKSLSPRVSNRPENLDRPSIHHLGISFRPQRLVQMMELGTGGWVIGRRPFRVVVRRSQ